MTKVPKEVGGLYFNVEKMALWISIATGRTTKMGSDNSKVNSGWEMILFTT